MDEAPPVPHTLENKHIPGLVALAMRIDPTWNDFREQFGFPNSLDNALANSVANAVEVLIDAVQGRADLDEAIGDIFNDISKRAYGESAVKQVTEPVVRQILSAAIHEVLGNWPWITARNANGPEPGRFPQVAASLISSLEERITKGRGIGFSGFAATASVPGTPVETKEAPVVEKPAEPARFAWFDLNVSQLAVLITDRALEHASEPVKTTWKRGRAGVQGAHVRFLECMERGLLDLLLQQDLPIASDFVSCVISQHRHKDKGFIDAGFRHALAQHVVPTSQMLRALRPGQTPCAERSDLATLVQRTDVLEPLSINVEAIADDLMSQLNLGRKDSKAPGFDGTVSVIRRAIVEALPLSFSSSPYPSTHMAGAFADKVEALVTGRLDGDPAFVLSVGHELRDAVYCVSQPMFSAYKRLTLIPCLPPIKIAPPALVPKIEAAPKSEPNIPGQDPFKQIAENRASLPQATLDRIDAQRGLLGPLMDALLSVAVAAYGTSNVEIQFTESNDGPGHVLRVNMDGKPRVIYVLKSTWPSFEKSLCEAFSFAVQTIAGEHDVPDEVLKKACETIGVSFEETKQLRAKKIASEDSAAWTAGFENPPAQTVDLERPTAMPAMMVAAIETVAEQKFADMANDPHAMLVLPQEVKVLNTPVRVSADALLANVLPSFLLWVLLTTQTNKGITEEQFSAEDVNETLGWLLFEAVADTLRNMPGPGAIDRSLTHHFMSAFYVAARSSRAPTFPFYPQIFDAALRDHLSENRDFGKWLRKLAGKIRSGEVQLVWLDEMGLSLPADLRFDLDQKDQSLVRVLAENIAEGMISPMPPATMTTESHGNAVPREAQQQGEKTAGGLLSRAKNIGAGLQGDAVEAAWRTAASQLVKLTREPLVAVLQRHIGPDDPALRVKIAAFLETEAGTAMLSAILSIGLMALPGNKMGETPARLSKELRIKAMADVGDLVADVLMGPLRQVVSFYLQDVGGTSTEAPSLPQNPVRELPAPTGPTGATEARQGAYEPNDAHWPDR